MFFLILQLQYLIFRFPLIHLSIFLFQQFHYFLWLLIHAFFLLNWVDVRLMLKLLLQNLEILLLLLPVLVDDLAVMLLALEGLLLLLLELFGQLGDLGCGVLMGVLQWMYLIVWCWYHLSQLLVLVPQVQQHLLQLIFLLLVQFQFLSHSVFILLWSCDNLFLLVDFLHKIFCLFLKILVLSCYLLTLTDFMLQHYL